MKTDEKTITADIEPVEIVDWYSQGESCSLQIGESRVVVRFIGRKGRRARIAVSASQRGNGEGEMHQHAKEKCRR